MFWNNFLVNYLSSVAAGITLLILGVAGYYGIRNKIKQDIKQRNKSGPNIQINTLNYHPTSDSVPEIKRIKKAIKKYS